MQSFYSLTPVPKPRMTRRDQWNPSKAAKRYFAFKDEVRKLGITVPESGVHVVFVMPMPNSWKDRKRAKHNNQPHQQKPDVDNLLKALLDAIYDNDAHIWDVRASKIWGVEGEIRVEMHT